MLTKKEIAAYKQIIKEKGDCVGIKCDDCPLQNKSDFHCKAVQLLLGEGEVYLKVKLKMLADIYEEHLQTLKKLEFLEKLK